MPSSSGGDESIPKFATFDDDGIIETPHAKNTRKAIPTSNLVPFPTFPASSGNANSSGFNDGPEPARNEAWSTFKGLLGRSTSATNLLSRLSLNNDEEVNNHVIRPSVPINKKHEHVPQDRPATLRKTETGTLSATYQYHEKSTNKSKDSHKKTTTFASSDNLDREAILLKQHYASKKSTFQNYSERMSVSVRAVDLTNRVAFARPPMPTGSLIREYADEMLRTGGLKGDNIDSVLTKLSPSPQYVDILNVWKRVPSIRLLSWSPSVSREADPFYGWSDDDDDDHDTMKNEDLKRRSTAQYRLERRKYLTRRRRRAQAKKDGRYLQIDITSYIEETLPPDSRPYLRLKKRRLPMRTDVGFNGPSEQEITIKEDEIRQEAVLEEISPRLIVLLTSDLIMGVSGEHKNYDASVHPEVLKFLFHKVPGIPFSGRELATAKQRNLKTRGFKAHIKQTADNDKSLSSYANQIGKQANPSESAVLLRPNQFSVFAPPLDASISSSQLWKPRPFFDRPSGFIYLMAVPVDVKFDIGDIEPLVCTLTLFSLPETNEAKYFKGKISEDFIFPAGDWNEVLSGSGDECTKQASVGVTQNHNREQSDHPNLQSWRRRKNKALFSFNPLDLPPSSNDEFSSLFLVLQIYQLMRKDAVMPYLDDNSPRKLSAKGNRMAGVFSGNRKRMASFDEDRQTITSGILSYLKMHGTQFLTPLCFGLIPVFHDSHFESIPQWPNGASQSMQLFAYPGCPESQGEFVDRLSVLSSQIKHKALMTMGTIGTVSLSDTRSSSEIIEEHEEGFEFFDTSTRNANSVKKRSTFNPFIRAKAQTDVILGNETVCGKAFIFTSVVEADFSQVMLQHPSLFEQETFDPLPHLLVNVSGDGAIMAQPTSEGDIVKRSSLLRLPISGDPSGYAESSEIREVLYMPSYLDNAEVTSATTQCSFTDINLLYIYPKVIKLGISQKLDDTHRDIPPKGGICTYVLEIGLVHRGTSLLRSVYNPTPGGKPLVHSVYTKIPLPFPRESSIDIRKGINLRDEVKIKLPEILDETYLLVFTVHAVHLNGDNENEFFGLNKIADSLYPLSTISSISDHSVLTIIQDGLHYVNVGNFQVAFNARVASNIHNSNSSIIAAANAIPSMEDMRSFAEGIPSFCNQLARLSSEATRIDYFYAWAYYFLSGCVALASNDTKIHSSRIHFKYKDALLAIMKSFLSLADLVKGEVGNKDTNKRKNLVKNFIDDFDDSSILYYLGDEVNGQVEVATNNKSIDLSPEEDFDDKIYADRDESSNAKARKSVKYSTDQSIFNKKNLNSTKQSGAFRRNAYGTSKSDRMKAEAVLNESSLMFSQLIDDEETIFTTGTWQTGLRSSMHPHSANYNYKIDDTYQKRLEHLAVEKAFSEKMSHNNSDGRNARRPISVVNQVNSVAQTLIIPCVFPAYSSGSPTKPIRLSKSNVVNDTAQKVDVFHHTMVDMPKTTSTIYANSSDIEDEKIIPKRKDFVDAFVPDSSFPLRGVGNWIIVASSFSRSLETQSRPRVYEVIIILWSEAWQEAKNGNVVYRPIFDAFINNIDFLIPLCLKSLILRCSEIIDYTNLIPSLLFDHNHINILSSLIDAITYGIMGELMKGNCQLDFDSALAKCLSLNDFLVDFLVGLLTVIHPAQVAWLISKYFDCLRLYDAGNNMTGDELIDMQIIKPVFLRIRGSRLLRLRAAEKIASLPRFIALNFPLKTSSVNNPTASAFLSWTHQIKTRQQEISDPRDIMNGLHRCPENNWLARLLVHECFTICAQSSFTLAAISASQSMKKRDTDSSSNIIVQCQKSIALHSVTIVYEVLLRSHATDRRYQSEESSYRVASVFLVPILDHSIGNIRVLSEMAADDTVRILWLSSVLYVLQESAESPLCNLFERIDINTFCHILRLCNETFQVFMRAESLWAVKEDLQSSKSLWLAQECFNTISACIILLINESCRILTKPMERTNTTKAILELLLYLLCIPHSSVTLLRILGAVSHILDKFGGPTVIEAMGDSLQNWGRVLYTLMNNTSLSVRSMGVDLIISFFCSAHKKGSDIHHIILVFLTVLPEAAAREIGLYSVSGLINDARCIEQAVWPLRRAIADIEACDPSDDDRLDAAFVPTLRHFCRSSQAIIDGVLIELRLKGSKVYVAGTKVSMKDEGNKSWPLAWIFDADEESLLEAADAFDPETSCMQRLRWLLLLRLLHERKGNWIESGETLVLCALVISQSISHAKKCWLPSRFDLWYDPRLASIEAGMPSSDWHSRLIDFFEPFLLDVESSNIPRPNVKSMCKLLTSVIKEIVKKFEYEGGVEALALLRMEQLSKVMMSVIEDHGNNTSAPSAHLSLRPGSFDEALLKSYTEAIEENAALRQVSSALNEMVTKLSGSLFSSFRKNEESPLSSSAYSDRSIFYVQFQVCGLMPDRYKESTTIPTFNTFNIPHVCRVPKSVVSLVLGSETGKKVRTMSHVRSHSQVLFEEAICHEFAQVYVQALKDTSPTIDILFCTDAPDEFSPDFHSRTYISVRCLSSYPNFTGLDIHDGFDRYLSARSGEVKKFYYEKSKQTKSTIEISVPRKFPCVLSRQPILLSMEFISTLENLRCVVSTILPSLYWWWK